MAVRPVGRVSETVTVPEVGPIAAASETVIVKVPVCPAAKFPVCDLAMLKSGGRVPMLTISEALLLAGFVSPPPLTVAVLVTEAGALAAMFTVRVIAG
jgi:hypothetical protein